MQKEEAESGGKGGADIFRLDEYLDSTFSSNQLGGTKKRLGVVFKNLTVVGEGADATSIATLLTPLEGIANLVNPKTW